MKAVNWFFESFRLIGKSVVSAFYFVYGLYRLSRLQKPVVSIFGGKAVAQNGDWDEKAYKFASRCTRRGMSIITGGGPGIMHAASCGALDTGEACELDQSRVLGIGVKGVDISFENPCSPVIFVNSLFVRKWLLIRYSCGFAIFPGGIGTADELFELLNLIKLKKMKRAPIFFIGVSYWQPMMDWYQQALSQGTIPADCKELVTCTDNLDEVFAVIHAYCQNGKD